MTTWHLHLIHNNKRFDLNKTNAFLSFLFLYLLAIAPCVVSSKSIAEPTQHLPKLGDSISSIISPEQEHQLGRAWLRSLRGQAPLINDPLLNTYITDLAYQIASESELEKPDLEVVMINSKAINAFAAPGGILGVNAGLILHAETEDELAAVLAHEMAHLSQRHFARNLEMAKRNQWTTWAALLASVALVASGSPDSGLATLATSQAAAMQSQLRFSRQNEREADRIGMQTLANLQRDPSAMPRFFSRMYKATQFYGEVPPEFLLTHPVTESRISDSMNRATQLPNKTAKQRLNFALMKARLQASFSEDKFSNVTYFKNRHQESSSKIAQQAARYGWARAHQKLHQYPEALKALQPLIDKDPSNIIYAITNSEILMAKGEYKEARSHLLKLSELHPNNFPLSIYIAQISLRMEDGATAKKILESLLLTHQDNVQVWRLLSEAQGLTGNIIGVHEARAEVFFLYSREDQAIKQLNYALNLVEDNFPLKSRLQHRLKEINAQKQLQFL